jgi:hypothetical protein
MKSALVVVAVIALGLASSGCGGTEEDGSAGRSAPHAQALPKGGGGGGGGNGCSGAGVTCTDSHGNQKTYAGCSVSCPAGQAPICLSAGCWPNGTGYAAGCGCLGPVVYQ